MILHIDMDAFFASVEQLDNPELRGKPVIIGGGQRGVVSTASYEARVFGVRSAMPITTARRLCPQGIFVRGRMRRYVELSRAVMSALRDFSPLVEQAGIDEAYLDISGLERLFGPPEALVPLLKEAVLRSTGGLTCSVGVAPLKFLAKVCSDINKPDGIFILTPAETDAFLCSLEAARLPGVGRRMVENLRGMGIVTVAQLRRYSAEFLEGRYGKWGRILYQRAHGVDERKIEPERVMKSESAECTFEHDTRDLDFLERILFAHAERVGTSLRKHGIKGRTVTLKVKFADFRQITRSRTLPEAVHATQTIFETGRDLLHELKLSQAVRLIGLGMSGFDALPVRLMLPGSQGVLDGLNGLGKPTLGKAGNPGPEQAERRAKLDSALDTLRQRFGKEAVQHGRLFTPKPDTATNSITDTANNTATKSKK